MKTSTHIKTSTRHSRPQPPNHHYTRILRYTLLCTLLCTGTDAARAQAPEAKPSSHLLTAREVIARIEANLAVTLPADTVDTIKAGDPDTPITGIATTFIPTMAVLRKAVAHGENLIVTHEPSFYNHRDESTLFTNDPVYLEKQAFLREHHVVLFRLHDGWHLRKPDGINEAWIHKAGWEQFRKPGEEPFFTIPPTTLDALAQHLQTVFGARIVRVIGDPKMSVTEVAYRPGASGEEKHIRALEREGVEVLVAGEASEWETVEYVRDAMQQGRHKALILLGHDTSEEIGMDNCAEWLRTILPSTKIEFIPAGEPYWLPGHPPTSP